MVVWGNIEHLHLCTTIIIIVNMASKFPMALKTLNTTSTKVKHVCSLNSMEEDKKHIELMSGRNIIGRNKDTGIRDTHCSKSQVELDVDEDEALVKLKVIGANPCGVNGFMIMRHQNYVLEHGDVLEIVFGKHPFQIVFKPPRIKITHNIEVPLNVEVAAGEKWDSIKNGKALVFTSIGVKSSDKIAAYDIDGTIITTKSGNVFPKSCDDWKILYTETQAKLKRLHENGYKICFFTNQGGIAKGKVNQDEFKLKIKKIIHQLGVPVQVYIAISDGYFRKPLPGMWNYLLKYKNDSLKVNLEKCFYVGDAAGRPEIGTGVAKRKKDHSLADRFFASNIQVSFYTPEEHFLGKKTEHWIHPEFEPSKVHAEIPLLEPATSKMCSDKCELILIIGLPGSGKSHFCQTHLAQHNYNIINGDKLGSTQACLKAAESSLSCGKSCAIDNTNVDIESRRKFCELASRLYIPCRCFVMNVTVSQVKHNIAFRQLTDSSHSKINEMVLNVMKKKYKAPTLNEGFTEIVHVNFKPQFLNSVDEELYKLYIVEK